MLLLLSAVLLASALSNFLLAEWWARLFLNIYEKWSPQFPVPAIEPLTEAPQTFARLTLGIKATAFLQAVAGIIILIFAFR